jgi:type IV pilus assembly protein PilA
MVSRIRKAMDERDQGFTLIELLVVIIIIGILAAIAIPVFLNQRKKGVDAGIKSDLKNAATNVETWATDNPSSAVPSGIVKGTGAPTLPAVVASAALTDFKPSPGNVVKLVGNSTAGSVGLYVLCGWNNGASTATDGTAGKFLKYDSNAGGMVAVASGDTC